MNPYLFSEIGHGGLDICNPIPKEKLEIVFDQIDFSKPFTAIDIGAGKCGPAKTLTKKKTVS